MPARAPTIDPDGTVRCPRDGRTLRVYSGDDEWLECPDCLYHTPPPVLKVN